MDSKQRYRRLRLLINRLNKERKKQAQKIDILCNDFICAQRDFISKLDAISFTAGFYQTILGVTDLNKLLRTASTLIRDELGDVSVVFFLRRENKCESHRFEGGQATTAGGERLEDLFTAELADAVCKSNKACKLEDMFAMGLQGNLGGLKKISGLTVPLGQAGSSLGFILIYFSRDKKLKGGQLRKITAATPGLSRAISACQALCRAAG